MTIYIRQFRYQLILSKIQQIAKYEVLISIAFIASISYLQICGFVAVGNDTGMWDVRYRAWASILVRAGDLPLWLPNGGNGFPHLSLYWVALVGNPIGTLIGIIRPYDHLSLAIETILWRIIGFFGSYNVAKTIIKHQIGAVSVACTYVGSGVMAWALLSYPVLIGLMLAPWLLASGFWLIEAQTTSAWLRASGTMAITFTAMVWCGYAGAWIMAPVLTGPLLLIVSLRTPRGPWRLLTGALIAGAAVLGMTGILISETLSLPIFDLSTKFRQETADMREGTLRFVDLFGAIYPLPSVLPTIDPPTSQPVFFGNLSACILIVYVWYLMIINHRWILWVTPMVAATISVAIVNTTPNFDIVSSFGKIDNILIHVVRDIFYIVVSILLFVMSFNHLKNKVQDTEKTLILYSGWVILVASNWSLANLLRYSIPPFQLVRYNYLYVWLPILLAACAAWIIIEKHVISIREINQKSPAIIPRLIGVGLSTLFGCVYIISSAIVTHNASAKEHMELSIGVPQLLWQILILVLSTLITGLIIITKQRKELKKREQILSGIIVGAAIIIFHLGMRIWNTQSSPTIVVNKNVLKLYLNIPIIIVLIILMICPEILMRYRRVEIIATAIIVEMILASPIYFSDNPNLAPPHGGWPYTPSIASEVTQMFKPLPGTSGLFRKDFWSMFDSTISPPLRVTRLQNFWGGALERWVLFPQEWATLPDQTDSWVTRSTLDIGPEEFGDTSASRHDVLRHTQAKVSREPLEEQPPANAVTQRACMDRSSGGPAIGYVSLLLATHVDVSFRSDCERLLVFSDSWAPGWRADIDGTPVSVVRVNGALRGVMVPPGEHELTWTYTPRYFWGLIISLVVGVAGSILMIAAPSVVSCRAGAP